MEDQLILSAKEKGFSSNLDDITERYYFLCEIQRWLREKHKILVLVECVAIGELFNYYNKWYKRSAFQEELGKGYRTYEEALEEGLKSAFKLI